MQLDWIRVVGSLLALCAVCDPGCAAAQAARSSLGASQPERPVTDKGSYGLEAGTSEFGAWFGVSLNSPAGDLSPNRAIAREFYIVGLRYGKVLVAGRELALEYVLDLVPVAVVTEIPRSGQVHYDPAQDTWVVEVPGTTARSPVYGLGLSPIGLRLSLWRSRRLRLFAGGTAGFLTFTREMPVPGALKLNYSFECGGGLQLGIAPGWAATLGLKLHHISSGTQTAPNPGLDAQILHLGVSHFRKAAGGVTVR